MADFEFAFFVLKSFLEEPFLYIELIFVILFEEPDSFFVTVLLLLDFFLQGVDFIGEITLELFSLEFELFEFGSELLHQVILGDFFVCIIFFTFFFMMFCI